MVPGPHKPMVRLKLPNVNRGAVENAAVWLLLSMGVLKPVRIYT